MPIYEYKCHKCGKIFTEIQGIKEDPLKIHEGCGGELERLISGGRLMLTDRKSGRADEDLGDMPGMPPMGDDFGDEDYGADEYGGDEDLGGGEFGGEDLGAGGDEDL